MRETAQLAQNLPGLQGGDGALAVGADAGVTTVDRSLVTRQRRPHPMALERRANPAACALVTLVGEGLHLRGGQGFDQAGGACRGQAVGGAG